MLPEPKFWLRQYLVCSKIFVNIYLARVAPPNLILERTPWVITEYIM